MNIDEYISTGILEAYALGDLTAAERAEVEKNISLYQQLKAELERIEEAQEQLLMSHAVQPSKAVKENLLRKLDSQRPQAKVVALNQSGNFLRYATAASIVIALSTSYLALTYYNKWQNTEISLSALIAQNQKIAQNLNTVNQRLTEIETDLRVTSNPAFNRILLKGTANTPDAMASVYWNSATQEVYLSIQNLNTLAQEHQYQLWAIVDGQPVDAGVFEHITDGLQKMKLMAGATAFAITIEPRGGKPSPTLEMLQVIGNVNG
ncbi:MAG: anti-sigma factor [Cytophagales bacterium]|nr:anti-sigma factor [Cytophagales bacterium]